MELWKKQYIGKSANTKTYLQAQSHHQPSTSVSYQNSHNKITKTSVDEHSDREMDTFKTMIRKNNYIDYDNKEALKLQNQ